MPKEMFLSTLWGGGLTEFVVFLHGLGVWWLRTFRSCADARRGFR